MIDCKPHFDMCAELNGWTHDEKGSGLRVRLAPLNRFKPSSKIFY